MALGLFFVFLFFFFPVAAFGGKSPNSPSLVLDRHWPTRPRLQTRVPDMVAYFSGTILGKQNETTKSCSILVFLDLRQFIRLTCNEINHSERECWRGTWHDKSGCFTCDCDLSKSAMFCIFHWAIYTFENTTFQFPFIVHISKCIP